MGGSGDWLGLVSSHEMQDMRLLAMSLVMFGQNRFLSANSLMEVVPWCAEYVLDPPVGLEVSLELSFRFGEPLSDVLLQLGECLVRGGGVQDLSLSLSVTGGWEPVMVQRESSDHGAMLVTSAMFLVIRKSQLTVSSLWPHTPYLDSAFVPPRFLPGM